MSFASSTHERWLTVDGYRYICRVVEQPSPVTEPVVLLGGSESDRFSWRRHERWLAQHATMITVDLPGYGEADLLPARYDIGFLAAVLDHMLEALRVPRANLFGACYGGAIALRCAQCHPDRVKRLLLAGMTPEIPVAFKARMRPWLQMRIDGHVEQLASEMTAFFMAPPQPGRVVRRGEALSRVLRRQLLHQTPETVAKLVEHTQRLTSHAWTRPELTVTTPALVFTGEHDTLTPPESGRALAGQLGSPFVTVKESDHLAPLERDQEVTDLMLRFFTGRPLDGLTYLNEVESPSPVDAGRADKTLAAS